MNLTKFENTKLVNGKIINYSKVEEAKRLADEFRSKPAYTIKADGFHYIKNIKVSAKKGIDIETCSFTDITMYIKTHKKISQSALMFLYRVMAVRFPTDFSILKKTSPIKVELELIESNATNDISWLGETGFQNCVRLDGRLSNDNLKVIKRKNDEIEIKRIFTK